MNNLIKNIRCVYPDLTIEECCINEIGQNNNVLIVNQSLVFRFPKCKNGITQLRIETEILKHIKDNISIPIPDPMYQYFQETEPGKVFTGYRLIDGVPLWKESLTGIKDFEVVKGLAEQLVSFLIELHSNPAAKISRELKLEIRNPYQEMFNLFSKIQHKLFPYIRRDVQKEITQAFDTFLGEEESSKLDVTLIHGDFGASNILWSPESHRISGVIDFGSAGLGDPAYDFAGILSSYGEEFFAMCISLYPNGNEITDRAQFYKSTFALQEALHGVVNEDRQAFESGMKEFR